jgi:small nuclear ribonucleoprotein (snRNP)-like protein
LSDVEERITETINNELTKKENITVQKKNFGLIFVRGDLVILISPSNK